MALTGFRFHMINDGYKLMIRDMVKMIRPCVTGISYVLINGISGSNPKFSNAAAASPVNSRGL